MRTVFAARGFAASSSNPGLKRTRGGWVASLSVVFLTAGVLGIGCGGDDKGTKPSTDTAPPAAVTNLAADSPTDSTITLNWTAPGDDDATGTAAGYDIRYSTLPITGANWVSASQATGEPAPHAAGTAESFRVARLTANTTYHFALKTRDEVPNWSALSNVPSGKTDLPPRIDDMVLIPAGTFMMGSPTDELYRVSDETQHAVILTRSFYLAEHEVTQSEWRAIMGWNDSGFQGDSLCPVEQVTWFDAVRFCNLKSTAEGRLPPYELTVYAQYGDNIIQATVTWNEDANGYRLPTEAEWEYGCRAGTETAFANGGITYRGSPPSDPIDPKLDLVGWYYGNSNLKTHPGGQKEANLWGLVDMHGNVGEWCWDWYDSYPAGSVSDPIGPSSGAARVVRGGDWEANPPDCRSAARSHFGPGAWQFHYLGLRLARNGP